MGLASPLEAPIESTALATVIISCLTLQEERHPSGMGIGTSKEGFSVFGMLNRCVSPMGRKLMRSWFLRPVVNLQASCCCAVAAAVLTSP